MIFEDALKPCPNTLGITKGGAALAAIDGRFK